MMTQQEIAKKLGISEMTVYRCVCNRGSVSQQTREKIENLVEECGYRPNLMARSLARKKSFLVGVLVPSLRNSFYLETLEVLQSIFKPQGYHLLLSSSNGSLETEGGELNVFCSIPVTGIIWSPMDGAKSTRNGRKVLRDQIPLVLFDRCFVSNDSIPNYALVMTDNVVAARQLTEYLIGLGHRQIILLTDNQDASCRQGFMKGYRDALASHNIAYDDKMIVTGINRFGVNFGRQVLPELLDKGFPFTAIQASSDDIAIGVMESARELHLNIPGDFSLTGFGADPMLPYLPIQLTTIQKAAPEIGRVAAEFLLEQITQGEQGQAAEIRKMELSGIFVKGDSCRAL